MYWGADRVGKRKELDSQSEDSCEIPSFEYFQIDSCFDFHWLECCWSATLKNRFEEHNLKGFCILGRKMFRNSLSSLARNPSSADIWSVNRYFLKVRNLKLLVKIVFKGDNNNCEWRCRDEILSAAASTILLAMTVISKTKTMFFPVTGGGILQQSKEWHQNRKKSL